MKKTLLVVFIFLILFLTGCSTEISSSEKYRGYTAEQLFTSSEIALSKHQYKKATEQLQALNAFYPFGPYSEQGLLDLIYAYYASDQQAAALAIADRYLRLYPRSSNAAYAYYMEGLIDFTYGETWLQRWLKIDTSPMDLEAKKKAYADFSQIVYLYPNSIYAPSAARYMIYIRNILARKQIIIAEFYLERRAYVAAANRASFVVEHFQGSPDIIEALVILVKCYHAMHLYALAENTLKILLANYPDDPQVKKLLKQLANEAMHSTRPTPEIPVAEQLQK